MIIIIVMFSTTKACCVALAIVYLVPLIAFVRISNNLTPVKKKL